MLRYVAWERFPLLEDLYGGFTQYIALIISGPGKGVFDSREKSNGETNRPGKSYWHFGKSVSLLVKWISNTIHGTICGYMVLLTKPLFGSVKMAGCRPRFFLGSYKPRLSRSINTQKKKERGQHPAIPHKLDQERIYYIKENEHIILPKHNSDSVHQ